TGAGQTYGVNYSRYLPPDGGRRTFWSVGLEDKLFNASKVDGVLAPGALDRGSRPQTLGYTAREEADTSAFNYNAEVAVNLPGSNGNTLEAYQADDARISTVRWSALRLGANYLKAFGSGWMWNLRGQLQYSPDALIAGEQFGLGGATSVRGTGERVMSGDSGLLASFELTTPELRSGLRMLAFLDAGRLTNNNAELSSSGKVASDQLASAGMGLHYAAGTLDLTAQWGRVLSGGIQPAGGSSSIPKTGDEKLHVNLTARF
ncbi:MAG: ShlB/FhaC/HecB family hemolysin secretion/activation protein, partial [Rhodoferax sp.]